MSQIEEIKNELRKALDHYSSINYEYKSKGGESVKKQMEDAKQEVICWLNKYIKIIKYLNREDIFKEYREALEFFDIASLEYDPYIVTTPLSPGENPPVTPFHELVAVSDKLELAQKWLDLLRKLL